MRVVQVLPDDILTGDGSSLDELMPVGTHSNGSTDLQAELELLSAGIGLCENDKHCHASQLAEYSQGDTVSELH